MATFTGTTTFSGARSLNRDAPNFFEPSVLYCDVLIYRAPNQEQPVYGVDIPTEMVSICRVNNVLWYFAALVKSTFQGDQLLQNSATTLAPQAVAQVIDEQAMGKVLYGKAGIYFYVIRLRVGTTVFQVRYGGTGSPPTTGNIGDASLPFLFSASIIRNTIKYTVDPDNVLLDVIGP